MKESEGYTPLQVRTIIWEALLKFAPTTVCGDYLEWVDKRVPNTKPIKIKGGKP
jgi:hypothetical protein